MTITHEKLHLGCGVKYIEGWFHIDALPMDHVDHVGPVEKLPYIEDNTVSLIYACHVLEHFDRKSHKQALAEWFRVLKGGGVLRLAVPDFEASVKLYVNGQLAEGIEQITGLVMGGQRDKYDHHGMIFDQKSLSQTLVDIGFESPRLWDWRKTEHADMDDYSQAYLPHMDKENGTLVSLNLEAIKP